MDLLIPIFTIISLIFFDFDTNNNVMMSFMLSVVMSYRSRCDKNVDNGVSWSYPCVISVRANWDVVLIDDIAIFVEMSVATVCLRS